MTLRSFTAGRESGTRRWLVLLGCFIGMGLAPPAILLQPMGLFLKSMSAEFGLSRTEFSGVIAIAALCNAIVMPIADYLARRFGGQAYARVFGTCFGITLLGAVIGPLAMASIFDRTGSYDLGLMLLPAFPVAAFGLLWLARPLRRLTPSPA